MKVLFEEKCVTLDEPIGTIETLCKSLNIDKENGIAISINDMVIPRTKWNLVSLTSEDAVTIIKATQGG
jgi:sulfur carrier protein